MAFLEHTLIALKLVLEKFDIDITEHLSIKQNAPDMDHITSVISLIQIIHDLDYDIRFIYDNGYKIRSDKLTWEVNAAIAEVRQGKLTLRKNMSLDHDFEYKVAMIKHCVFAPPDVPFNNHNWMCFVGFYNTLAENYTDEGIAHVLFMNCIEYLPYFMIAEQQIAEVKNYVG